MAHTYDVSQPTATAAPESVRTCLRQTHIYAAHKCTDMIGIQYGHMYLNLAHDCTLISMQVVSSCAMGPICQRSLSFCQLSVNLL